METARSKTIARKRMSIVTTGKVISRGTVESATLTSMMSYTQ